MKLFRKRNQPQHEPDTLEGLISFWRGELDKDPNDVKARAMLATALGWSGQPRKAVEEFTTCLRHDPHNSTAWLWYGVFQCVQGDVQSGVKNLEQAVTHCTDIGEQVNAVGVLGAACHMSGDLSRAIRTWEVLLPLPPHPNLDFPLHLSLAISYLQNGWIERALEEFKYAHSIREDDSTVARRTPGMILSMTPQELAQWPSSSEAQKLLNLLIPLTWGICRPQEFF